MPGGLPDDKITVGSKLKEHRGAFLLANTMKDGQIVDWDGHETLLRNVYTQLKAKPEEYPLLITQVPQNPTRYVNELAQVCFETLNVPSLLILPPAVLALYASARTTGVVLDLGDSTAHCVAVYQGHALQYGVQRSHAATGRAVTKRTQQLLQADGYRTTTTAQVQLVQELKEKYCTLEETANTTTNKNTIAHTLPDGQVIDISPQTLAAPNCLLDTSLIGSEDQSATDLLANALHMADTDLRAPLAASIVLTGGTTLTRGLGPRLVQDLAQRVHAPIRIAAPPERAQAAFTGGSILASLSTFKDLVVTKQDFAEDGNIYRGMQL